MWSASYLSSADPHRASARRRAASFLLTVMAHLLLLLLLLRLAPTVMPEKKERATATFSLLPAPGDAPKPAPKTKPAAAAVRRASAAAAPKAPAPPPPVIAKAKTLNPAPPKPLLDNPELFEMGDIGKLPSHAEESAGNDTGKDSKSVYGPGEGSGGQRLYNVEWVREPYHSELSTYMPASVPPGSWGMIACQTIPQNHVDNCRSIGENPAGSGLGRGLRLAAWQFLVRPPRIGGKSIIGAWVRIRIDFTDAGPTAH